MKKNSEHLSLFSWLEWSVATVIAAATLCFGLIAWSEDKFISKDVMALITQRLDRIEAKLDTLLNFRN